MTHWPALTSCLEQALSPALVPCLDCLAEPFLFRPHGASHISEN
ncbi:hypothetical protein C7S13_4656 [Burkholderia cepacia]|nr:hypothetical protein [Burkholderia cepacia]